jgi:hypothetical protein
VNSAAVVHGMTTAQSIKPSSKPYASALAALKRTVILNRDVDALEN